MNRWEETINSHSINQLLDTLEENLNNANTELENDETYIEKERILKVVRNLRKAIKDTDPHLINIQSLTSRYESLTRKGINNASQSYWQKPFVGHLNTINNQLDGTMSAINIIIALSKRPYQGIKKMEESVRPFVQRVSKNQRDIESVSMRIDEALEKIEQVNITIKQMMKKSRPKISELLAFVLILVLWFGWFWLFSVAGLGLEMEI